MSIFYRFLGFFLAVAYALERGRFGSIRLRWFVLMAGSYASVVSLLGIWRGGLTAAGLNLVVATLLYCALLWWAERQRFVLFRPSPNAMPARGEAPAAEEKLLVRGSGLFEVGDQKRRLVHVPVVFWTTRLGDQILAARVSSPSFLGIGVPAHERGWWYAFTEPRQLLEVSGGVLFFGFRALPALCLLYQAGKSREAVYLTCTDAAVLGRVRKALQP